MTAKKLAKARTPARAKPVAALDIDIIVQADAWREHRHARALVRRAVGAAAETIPTLRRRAASVAVALTDDAAIKILNRTWRGKNKPTNVLSFPASSLGGPQNAPINLGDIIVAYETLTREAVEEGKPFADHLTHLIVHGFLHLVGFDHETDSEAEEMEQREREILATLGIPDPYAEPLPARVIKARR